MPGVCLLWPVYGLKAQAARGWQDWIGTERKTNSLGMSQVKAEVSRQGEKRWSLRGRVDSFAMPRSGFQVVLEVVIWINITCLGKYWAQWHDGTYARWVNCWGCNLNYGDGGDCNEILGYTLTYQYKLKAKGEVVVPWVVWFKCVGGAKTVRNQNGQFSHCQQSRNCHSSLCAHGKGGVICFGVIFGSCTKAWRGKCAAQGLIIVYRTLLWCLWSHLANSILKDTVGGTPFRLLLTNKHPCDWRRGGARNQLCSFSVLRSKRQRQVGLCVSCESAIPPRRQWLKFECKWQLDTGAKMDHSGLTVFAPKD